jgi:BMFP domain-containing protein YqiC
MESRWGGWYVTGQTGKQKHVGNILVTDVQQLVKLDSVRRENIDMLDGLFDTKPYLTDKSDVVALLVLQHQVTVQNLLTRANFEVRTALARAGEKSSALSAKTTGELHEYLDALAKAMLFGDAAPFIDTIRGNSGFAAWFQKQGIKDPQGRSLRDFDLQTRLFRYPLSYLVYTPSFEALPDYARDYVFGRFAGVLQGRDTDASYAFMSAADRRDTLQVLTATDPAFAKYLARHPAATK